MQHDSYCAQRYSALGTGQLGFDSLGDIVEDEGSPSPSLEHRSHFKAHTDSAAAAPGPYAGPCQALASLVCILHALLCSVQSTHACGHVETKIGYSMVSQRLAWWCITHTTVCQSGLYRDFNNS